MTASEAISLEEAIIVEAEGRIRIRKELIIQKMDLSSGAALASSVLISATS